jgi:hypothetical protein
MWPCCPDARQSTMAYCLLLIPHRIFLDQCCNLGEFYTLRMRHVTHVWVERSPSWQRPSGRLRWEQVRIGYGDGDTITVCGCRSWGGKKQREVQQRLFSIRCNACLMMRLEAKTKQR